MKNLQNLGKALSKKEQTTVFGGVGPIAVNGCRLDSGSALSGRCACIMGGRIWNSECKRCEEPNVYYFSDAKCNQLFIG